MKPIKRLWSEAELGKPSLDDTEAFIEYLSKVGDNINYFTKEIDFGWLYIKYSKYPFFHISVVLFKPIRLFIVLNKDQPI